MPIEIERKFLIRGDFRPFVSHSERICQGYLCASPERTVRVRIKGDKGYLTIKGKSNLKGLARYEWEKEVPVNEAEELLTLCHPGVIEKVRHLVEVVSECDGFETSHVFEIDVFEGANQGLVLAEVELRSEDEAFPRPEWLGEEVTGDKRYYNSWLSSHPYTTWE